MATIPKAYVGLAFSALAGVLLVQTSAVVHELGHAYAFNGVHDHGARTHIPSKYYIPFYGFSQTGAYTSLPYSAASTAKNMIIMQAGFGSQIVYLLLAIAALFSPRFQLPCLVTAVGFLVYMFVYPHVAPKGGNDFAGWA